MYLGYLVPCVALQLFTSWQKHSNYLPVKRSSFPIISATPTSGDSQWVVSLVPVTVVKTVLPNIITYMAVSSKVY